MSDADQIPEDPAAGDAYALFQRGSQLLHDKHWMQAAVSLEQARSIEPEKASIREALGRAYFRAGRFDQAAGEFEAVVEKHPDDDYAHFCLGRSYQQLGDLRRARRHLSLASGLRPDRRDYRIYRDRSRGD